MRRFWAGGAAALVVLVAGCGSGGQASPGGRASQGSPGVSSSPVSPAAAASSPAASASGKGQRPVVVVVDSSGSMKQADAGDGLTRMKAAQDAVASLVAGLDRRAPVGLVAYGSRTPGEDVSKAAGCADVAVEQPLAAGAGAKVVAGARALRPGGWTPIAGSLRTAAQQLGGRQGTIVLVSDGADTCAPPQPCEEARQLRRSNPGLTISTVGFKSDQEQLQCVASAAGGTYVTADNAAQLSTRLQASADAEQARQKVSPQGAQGVAVGQTYAQVRKAHPDFPALSSGTTRTVAGRKVVLVVWRNCQWGFDGQELFVINPLAGRTIDDLGVGSSRSQVEAVLGQPVTGAGTGDSVRYTADKAKGLAWDVTYDTTNRVTVIILCHCLPKEQGSLPQGFGRQWEVHGLQLAIRENGTAMSSARTYDPQGCGGEECYEVKEFRASPISGHAIRLEITDKYRVPLSGVSDDFKSVVPGTQRYPSQNTETTIGDYYTLTVQSDGNALTALYSAGGTQKNAGAGNGLGTPWICTPQTHDASKCGA